MSAQAAEDALADSDVAWKRFLSSFDPRADNITDRSLHSDPGTDQCNPRAHTGARTSRTPPFPPTGSVGLPWGDFSGRKSTAERWRRNPGEDPGENQLGARGGSSDPQTSQ